MTVVAAVTSTMTLDTALKWGIESVFKVVLNSSVHTDSSVMQT